MAGPVGYGVHKALQEQRAKRGRVSTPRTGGEGWWVFVASTMCMSWLTAGLLQGFTAGQDQPLMIRLLWASVFYALTMGWQPIVAAWFAKVLRDRNGIDAGLQWPRLRDIGLAVVGAIGIATAAMIVARIDGEPTGTPAVSGGFASAAAAAGAMLVLCLQATSEEYGWRGAPLAYAVEKFGARLGLVIHGLAWGAWYAPLFLLSTPTPRESLSAAGGFVVTCLLLGIVFGWLRLRSRSILPSAIANALLTVVAGLPLLLHDGTSTGIRDAVFRWPGWPVLGVCAVLVLLLGKRGFEQAAR